jgi:hypothetical protein
MIISKQYNTMYALTRRGKSAAYYSEAIYGSFVLSFSTSILLVAIGELIRRINNWSQNDGIVPPMSNLTKLKLLMREITIENYCTYSVYYDIHEVEFGVSEITPGKLYHYGVIITNRYSGLLKAKRKPSNKHTVIL